MASMPRTGPVGPPSELSLAWTLGVRAAYRERTGLPHARNEGQTVPAA